MAAAAHQSRTLAQPAGGRAEVTPGRPDQGTAEAGSQPHCPHCCWTAGEADGGVHGRCVNVGTISRGQGNERKQMRFIKRAHLPQNIIHFVMCKQSNI